MTNNLNNDIKYSKSKNNFQCIGPCYPANTTIIHPITFDLVTQDNPFCPIVPVERVFPDGDKLILNADTCLKPTNENNINLGIEMLVPYFDFNYSQFLKIYYSIFSFEDALSYIENKKYIPISTKIRILECAWKSFGKEIDIIDQRLVDIYIEIIKKKWIDNIYKQINSYINIIDNNIKIVEPEYNRLRPNEFIVERTNYIINKFFTHDIVYKFLTKYIKHRKDEWDNIGNHNEKIKYDIIDYITNKIKLTINE